MGNGIGWSCGSCGAGETFQTGCGFSTRLDKELENDIRKGVYGALAGRLLGQEGMHFLPYQTYYRCPDCGTLEQARAIMIVTNDWDGKLWAFPETLICSDCKSEIFTENEFPYPESALQELISAIAHDGCPECGSKDVHETLICWD